MLEGFGQRQQELLKLLNRNKSGCTIDEIAEATQITRTAVRQHLAALEGDGLVKQGELRVTAGRPSRLYVLAERGMELFPRQYSWFSELMLEAIRRERGAEGLSAWLRELARSIASAQASGLEGASLEERLEATVTLMNALAYDAAAADGKFAIEASNCVFHHLAAKFPEVCHFDRALIEGLLGTSVDMPACMAHGQNVCRFVAGSGSATS
ncbi:MAG TPA: HTH domain-containing protein [Oscillatoriaceae cyanobacterium]